jgi:hypothetical protein
MMIDLLRVLDESVGLCSRGGAVGWVGGVSKITVNNAGNSIPRVRARCWVG